MSKEGGEDRRPVAILGAGRLGARVATLLTALVDTPIRLIDRDPAALARARDRLPDAEVVEADPTTPDAVAHVLDGCRLAILGTPAESLPAAVAAQAALRVGAGFMDAQFSLPGKLKAMAALAPRVTQANLTFVTDCGARPGLPALLARWAVARMDRIQRLSVALSLSAGEDPSVLEGPMLREHLVQARRGNPTVLAEGKPRKLQARYFPVFRFPPPHGRRVGYPVFLGEFRGLRDLLPGLEDGGFYLCGFTPKVDYWTSPIARMLERLGLPGAGNSLLLRSLAEPGTHAGMLVALEMEGVREGRAVRGTLTLSHGDPHHLPAACMAVTAARLLDAGGEVGIHQQGLFLDPDATLSDLATLGVALDQAWAPAAP
jgi:hypothetical protein